MLQHGDSNAIIEIIHTLDRIYTDRQIEIVNSEEYLMRNGPALDNDIVCTSGPYYNRVTQEIIGRLRLPVSYELDPKKLNKFEDPVFHVREAGRRTHYETGRDNKGKIVSDIAFFARISNPFAAGRFIYLIMGNNTQGTYAAANLFGISSPYLLGNYEFLRDKLVALGPSTPGFGIIARASVIGDYVEPVELRNCEGLKFLVFSPYDGMTHARRAT